MSAGALALGANGPVPAAADTLGLDTGVVGIVGFAHLNGADPTVIPPATSAFPCAVPGSAIAPGCAGGFTGACVVGASISVPDVGDTGVTSIVGGGVDTTPLHNIVPQIPAESAGAGDGCGAVNDSPGTIQYWEPPGGLAGTATGTLVINEKSGDVPADTDTFTENFQWFRVGLTAAVILSNVCESPCGGGPVPGAGAAAAIFVPKVVPGDSACFPNPATGPAGCPATWNVFIASVGAFLANSSDV